MSKSQNIFDVLDSSDEEEAPKQVQKTQTSSSSRNARAGTRTTRKVVVPSKSGPANTSAVSSRPDTRGRDARSHDRRGGDKPRRGRENDRQSGTGRGREVAKNGGGRANWGKPGDEEKPATVDPSDPMAPEATAEAEAEPVDTGLTMEDYLTQLSEQRQGELFAKKEKRAVKEEGDAPKVQYKKEEVVQETIGGGKKKAVRSRNRNRRNVAQADLWYDPEISAAKARQSERRARPEGDRRGPRPEGDRRGPRPEGDRRGPRPEGDRRGPRPEGDRRGPRPEGARRGPRPEGDRRGPRPEGDRRGPRPEGDRRGPRPAARAPRGPRINDTNAFPAL